MTETRWDHRHKWWHDLLTLFFLFLRDIILVFLGIILSIGALYFLFTLPFPLSLVVALPFLAVGLAFVFLVPLDFIHFLFDPKDRRSICLFCQPLSLKDLFVPNSTNNHFFKIRK